MELKDTRMEPDEGGVTSVDVQKKEWKKLEIQIKNALEKATITNVREIVVELLQLNLLRGSGIFCNNVMHIVRDSRNKSILMASIVSAINSKIPFVGELLVSRLLYRIWKTQSKWPVSWYSVSEAIDYSILLGNLAAQNVIEDVILLQIIMTSLEQESDDPSGSITLCIKICFALGDYLAKTNQSALASIVEALRGILSDGKINEQTQGLLESFLRKVRSGFKGEPIPSELDLIEEQDQNIHESFSYDVDFIQNLNIHNELDKFKYSKSYDHETLHYNRLKAEIFGEDSQDDDEYDDKETNLDDNETKDENEVEEDLNDDEVNVIESEAENEPAYVIDEQPTEINEEDTPIKDNEEVNKYLNSVVVSQAIDMTETETTNLRKAIYLTIMSTLSFEECAHRLIKLQQQQCANKEKLFASMVLQCCSEEKTYIPFYGLVAERLIKINEKWEDVFMEVFAEIYSTSHMFELSRLRNIAKFFAHILSTNVLPWDVFAGVQVTETDTTSSSRIFLKVLFQEMLSTLGFNELKKRLTIVPVIITEEQALNSINKKEEIKKRQLELRKQKLNDDNNEEHDIEKENIDNDDDIESLDSALSSSEFDSDISDNEYERIVERKRKLKMIKNIKKEIEILKDEIMLNNPYSGLFPMSKLNGKSKDDTRFSINFFTSIGLGALTIEMRDYLKNS